LFLAFLNLLETEGEIDSILVSGDELETTTTNNNKHLLVSPCYFNSRGLFNAKHNSRVEMLQEKPIYMA
jgi:hypothetical protein